MAWAQDHVELPAAAGGVEGEVELIEDVPIGHVGGDLGQEVGQVSLEVFQVLGILEGALLLEPLRVREMVQGDKDLDALRAQPLQFVNVVRKCRLVALSFQGLDAAPFDGHAVGLVSGLGEKVDVLAVEVPVIGGLAGLGEVRVVLLLAPMIGVDVVPFDLIARRRASPEKSFWKSTLR